MTHTDHAVLEALLDDSSFWETIKEFVEGQHSQASLFTQLSVVEENVRARIAPNAYDEAVDAARSAARDGAA